MSADFIWTENSLSTYLYLHKTVDGDTERINDCLYFSEAFLSTQPQHDRLSFLLLKNAVRVAAIYFASDTTGKIISPAKAPFGGIHCVSGCTSEDLYFLMSCVEHWASEHNIQQIEIKTAPEFYNTLTANQITETYLSGAYSISKTLTNFHIVVSKASFLQKITNAENRRLKKCKRAHFQVSLARNTSFEDVYDFIQQSRVFYGYELSLGKGEFMTMLQKFQDHIAIFQVRDDEKIIACAVCIRPISNILYQFLPADLPEYRAYSPTVLLLETIYHHCQQSGITIIDLGTSMDHHGIEKPGLLRFKKNMGGIESRKLFYSKSMTQTKGDQ